MEKYPLLHKLIRRPWLYCVCLVLAAGCLLWYQTLASSYYFSAALRSYGIEERVTVKERAYVVKDGKVLGGGVSVLTEARILRTAYALVLAQRSPLANIAGTDPARLATGAQRLQGISASYATISSSQNETQLNRAALLPALYPARFLTALAEAELQRQTFLQDHSERSARRYQTAVMHALDAGQRDIHTFKAAFTEVANNDESARISDVGGTITFQNLFLTIDYVEKNMEHTKRLAAHRAECLSGFVSWCESDDLAIPAPAPISEPDVSHKNIQDAAHIRTLFASALESPDFNKRTLIITGSSTCMSTLPGPYIFNAPSQEQYNSSSLPYFLNDIFFTPTNINAPMLNYLRDTLHISYSFINPLVFYHCPDTGADVSEVLATTLTRHFIGNNLFILSSSLTPELRQRFFTYFIDTEAKSFLLRAVTTETERSVRDEVTELLLMFKNKSAGLDRIVTNIADTQESHLRAWESGLSVDTSLRVLFLAQSAFPSLFQSYNPSFSAADGHPIRSTDAAEPLSTVRYSNLSTTVSEDTFIHDLRMFFSFERTD